MNSSSDRAAQVPSHLGSLPPRVRVFLALAMLFHLSLIVPWPKSLWTYFTFDSAATRGQRGWDFYALYQAGHNALTGVSIYDSQSARVEVVVPPHTDYRYLPILALTLGVVVNALPPEWAYTLWVLVVELVLLRCAYASWRLGSGPTEAALLAGMWLLFTPYYLESYLGQFSLVQGALLLAMMMAARRGPMGWRYDLAWVASLLWKQNSGLLIPLLLRLKRYRALALGSLAVGVTSAPYFLLMPGSLAAFGGNFLSGPPDPQLGNLGVRQFLYSVASALFPSLAPAWHSVGQRGWVLLVLGVGLYITWRSRRSGAGQPDTLLHLCFWIASYFLIYHDVWEHHYVLLLPVFTVLYHKTRSPLVLVLFLATALWTPYILIDPRGLAGYHMPMRWTPLEPRALDVAYHASKALPTLLLWGFVVRQIVQMEHAKEGH